MANRIWMCFASGHRAILIGFMKAESVWEYTAGRSPQTFPRHWTLVLWGGLRLSSSPRRVRTACWWRCPRRSGLTPLTGDNQGPPNLPGNQERKTFSLRFLQHPTLVKSTTWIVFFHFFEDQFVLHWFKTICNDQKIIIIYWLKSVELSDLWPRKRSFLLFPTAIWSAMGEPLPSTQ